MRIFFSLLKKVNDIKSFISVCHQGFANKKELLLGSKMIFCYFEADIYKFISTHIQSSDLAICRCPPTSFLLNSGFACVIVKDYLNVCLHILYS